MQPKNITAEFHSRQGTAVDSREGGATGAHLRADGLQARQEGQYWRGVPGASGGAIGSGASCEATMDPTEAQQVALEDGAPLMYKPPAALMTGAVAD